MTLILISDKHLDIKPKDTSVTMLPGLSDSKLEIPGQGVSPTSLECAQS